MNSVPCPDFEALLERFGDGETDAEETLRLREHLSACAPCRIGLRSITDLNRRVAQSPAPPAPPGLEERLRQAIRNAARPRRFRVWMPAAAAAAVLGIAVLLLRPAAARAEVPSFIAATVAVHDSFLAGSAAVEAKPSVPAPEIDEGSCVGGCSCSVENRAAPWILYRRGGTAISLILVAGAAPLPETSRRSRAGRDYHAFQVGANAVVVCRAGSDAHVWISRLPGEELAACALETRASLSGEKLSIRGVACRACCAGAESCAKKIDGVTDARVNLSSMEMVVTGRTRLDLDRVARELREAGFDVRDR